MLARTPRDAAGSEKRSRMRRVANEPLERGPGRVLFTAAKTVTEKKR
jgi:hypothetical protein